jgi:predicted RNA-binding protein YlxR (DUF448 family)
MVDRILQIHVPERRCAACGRRDAKASLCRLVRIEGAVKPDPLQKVNGRGAYLCPSEACWARAGKKHGVERSLRLGTTVSELDWSRMALAFGLSPRRDEERHGCRKEHHCS